MTNKHIKSLQILAQEYLPPKRLWSENADFKFSVNSEGEDVNKNPRSRRNIASRSEGNADNKTGTGDWNQRHHDRFTLSKTQIS